MSWQNNFSRRNRRKTPTIFQMESAESGAACLGMLMSYYGKNIPLSEIRVACDITRDGSKMSNMMDAAKKYGLDANSYTCDIKTLQKKENFPCIIFWEFNHFVVLEGITRKKAYLNDPATGPRTVTLKEFGQSFTGVVLDLIPAKHFKPEGVPPSNPMKLLWEWVTLDKVAVAYLIVLSAVIGIFSTFPSLIVKVFVDTVLVKQYDWSFYLLLQIFLLAIISGGLVWFLRYYLNRYIIKAKNILLSKFIWRLLHLPFTFFQQRMLGDIAERVDVYNRIGWFVADHVIENVITLIVTFFYLSTMFLINVKLAFCVMGLVAINLSMLGFLKKGMNNTGQYVAQKKGQLVAIETLTIENMESLKANAQENYYFQNWAGHRTRAIKASQASKIVSSLLELFPACFLIINKLVILGYGCYLIYAGQMTVGGIIAFQYLSASFFERLPKVFLMFATLSKLKGNLCRILDIQEYPDDKVLTYAVPPSNYSNALLSIEHLHFGYSHHLPSLPLLTDFSLYINAGQKVGVIGNSGAGKSTLLRLICDLYKPWQGGIYLKGKPIWQIPPHERAKSIGYVSQDIYLFEGSIRDNLSFWREDVLDDDIYDLLAALDLEEIVNERGGLNATIVSGGGNFSGGQRQRFEIVRALLLRPELLILDEATSALDNITERKVYDIIPKYAKSALIIAHRFSAIQDCDHILVIDNGIVIESGNHASLLQANGFYAQQITQGEL